MRKVDTSLYSSLPTNNWIQPETVHLGDLPKIKSRKKKADQEVVISNQETVIPQHQDTISSIRKAVRELGKEAATHRFTQEEKQKIADIIYMFRQSKIRTSENEIVRIAINYILEDHQNNSATSILSQVLDQLNQ